MLPKAAMQAKGRILKPEIDLFIFPAVNWLAVVYLRHCVSE